ncbi:CdaR family protein [Companilactobacillus sp.]|jgi:YbbR domain-containing protein|uniref:CdaR family protein n=1 Tax=Companilactobacillus sp. TaxID=2767905 RepID=UPI0025B7F6F1|nr:CdaR family protein [Companilactobacillus sp.]MCH4008747.1 CdaR family protein [Companilactobacillus sp.]MCH4051074.1 CdaR family protein [Companilactobacillus sp.]MCH4076690.1 CdaR family protein [Companilactobacillus sp.]MCH4125265.1 CdaR family protein [Companilactobacillus sp.]MCH4131805.1 CdaR family protein [Companilactobacillus sp.]
MMKKIINSNYFYAFISLCGALWLFFMVSTPGVGSTRDSNQSNQSTVNTKATMTVPLQVQANTDAYYITGYPQSVKVTIEGPSALVTATKNTQNFSVYLNLRQYLPGKHKVRIQQNGLNSELTYTIKPKYVNINIQKRMTKSLPVNVQFNKNSIASGYSAGKPVVSPDTVKVTGAASDVKKIKKLIVKPILPKGIKNTFDQEVLIQALDKNGKTLNVTLEPQTAHVKIPINLPSKKVSINFTQQGDSPTGMNFSFDSDVTTITVFGTQKQLDAIEDSINIPVDISGVTNNSKHSINVADALKGQIVSSDPDLILVNITVSSTNGTGSNSKPSPGNGSSSNTNSNTSEGSSNSSTTSNGNNNPNGNSNSTNNENNESNAND